MSTRGIRLVLLLALAFAATGCAFTKPTLTFKNARATDIDLEGANLQITFALKNPNPIAVNLASVSYKLEVEGRQVISGKPPNGLHVPATGVADLTFPTRVRFQDIAPVLSTFLTRDSASYRASGTVGIQTPLGVIELPLSHQGTFPVPKMPQVAFQQPRIQGLSFDGARIVFPLQITNRNPFPLPLGGMSATFAVGGANVGTVQAVTPASLAGNQAQVVEIPVQVSFLQAGMAVANAIRSGQAHVKLDAALKSGNASLPISLSENLRFK
ncbi:MAG: LEA type 2 family protein [Deltaproteobacteria bacterium]|nr:LEA type 2 family protein [Deltaproteobacteria bacterium]